MTLDRPPVSAAAVAELLEQVVRIAHSRAFAAGLNPAQWTALRFFARANPSSRTVSGFARYHASARGTASQTTSALVRKGYLVRVAVEGRGHSHRLEVTGAGADLLEADPVRHLVAGIDSLPIETRYVLAEALENLVGHLFAGGVAAADGEAESNADGDDANTSDADANDEDADEDGDTGDEIGTDTRNGTDGAEAVVTRTARGTADAAVIGRPRAGTPPRQ